MDVTCASCGAENPESARFCRKCGTPLGDAAFTEAPTRSLEGNPDTAPRPRSFETFPSAPLGPEPGRYAPPVHTPESANLHAFGQQYPSGPIAVPVAPPPLAKPSSTKRLMLVVGAILLVAVLGGVGMIAVIVSHIHARGASHPPVVAVPDPPAVPGSGGKSKRAKSDGPYDPDRLPEALKPWYYESASGTPVIQQNGKTALLIMKTDDDASDVADYYRDKFAELKSTPNQIDSGTDVVLTSTNLDPGVNVIISENSDHDASDDDEGDDDGDGRTDIVVTVGGPSIPIPNIPHFGKEAPVAPPQEPSVPPPPAPPAGTKENK